MNDQITGPSWDLTPVYKNLKDPQIEQDLNALETLLFEIDNLNIGLDNEKSERAKTIFAKIEEATELFSNLSTYSSCLLSVDSGDEAAQTLSGRLQRYRQQLGTYSKPLHQFEMLADESELEAYLSGEKVEHARFSILHRRQLSSQILSRSEEELIEGLSQNGLHAWGNLYDQLSGTIECDVLVGNQNEKMGLAQAATLMMDQDDLQRKNSWQAINHSWSVHEEACAASINAISGWRLDVCNKRSHKESVGYLDSAVHLNKISMETLTALMASAQKHNGLAQRAARLQARAMGKERLSPWDSRAPAPCLQAGVPEQVMTFEEAVELIEDAFSGIDKGMGEFVQKMAKDGWIEGTISSKKRPGAYCTSFSKSRTPRVYMTYSGSTSDVITLAHELGHALHFWVMRDLPECQRRYGMSLAETASTLGETAVRNALLEKSVGNAEKLNIMWEELSAFTTFMLNIPTRFEFEKRLYELRAEKPLRPDELRQIMSDSWLEWYGDSISEPDPMFWASKLHFYISGLSFYNFPYLFGYLFSLGVYRKRHELGDEFYSKYCDLLRDTGRMTAENLATHHLGCDIRDQAFWDEVIDSISPRVDAYEKLLSLVKP